MFYFNETSMEEKIGAALGRIPCDLVLKGGHVFNVFTRKWEDGDVAVSGGQIVGIGEYSGKEELDVTGRFVTPGFIDAHVHPESSLLAPRELAKVLLLNGVTSIVADPAAVTNVAGVAGFKFILSETENMPFSVYVMVPGRIPVSDLETPGARLGAVDLASIARLSPRVLGLAQLTGYSDLFDPGPKETDKLKLFAGSKIDGHAPAISGHLLNAYAASGITTEHGAATVEEAEEKASRGLYVFLREGSAFHELVDLLPVLDKVDESRFCLATDDRRADDIISEGSINYLLEIGVAQGYAAERLIGLASFNAARCFGLKNIGALAPGYAADINVFGDLETFQPQYVIKNGIVAVRDKKLQWESVPVLEKLPSMMHIKDLTAEDLKIAAVPGRRMRAIGLARGSFITEDLLTEPLVRSGEAVSDVRRDILKTAVLDRHHGTENCGLGFVKGLGLKKGAIATTLTRGTCQLAVSGTNDQDMVLAANKLKETGGGMCIVEGGEVRATVPLPVAGIMSDRKANVVNSQLKQLEFWLRELGTEEDTDPFSQLSFITFALLPHIRLTDRGLVDTDNMQFTGLFETGGEK